MPNLKKISVGAPLKSENAHQKFWLHLYSTQIEKLKTAEPRLLLKKSDPYSFDSELADEESSESESEESDSEDDYWKYLAQMIDLQWDRESCCSV